MDQDDDDQPAYEEEEHEIHEDLGMDDDEPTHELDHSTTDLELSVSSVPTEIKEFCLAKFKSTDFIMEPVLMEFLSRYFAADGDAAAAIEALSSSYEGTAQYVNMFAEWLIVLGVEPTQVEEHIENYLEDILIKSFDPRKADRIMQTDPPPLWLNDLIAHKHWRKMIYRLAEAHRECQMLNFIIKLISDAGYQNEIPTTTTAVNQMDVFMRVFDSAFGRIVDHDEHALEDFTKLITNSECAYLVAQLVMGSLIEEAPGGRNLVKIMQDVNDSIKSHQILHILLIAARSAAWPRAVQAVASMLSKKSLNPADIQILYQMYSSHEPPPVALLRFKDLIELLIESLFTVDSKIPVDHRPKYIFLLGYAAAVAEKWASTKKAHTQIRMDVNKEDLKLTQEAIRKVLEMIAKGQGDIITELQAVFTVLKFPVISMGMLYWIGKIIKEPSYFKFAGENRHTPVHLIIVDEIATLHPHLHKRILALLVELFEAPWPQMDVLIRLELQKMFLDRMIHLVSCGCAIPVLQYVKRAYTNQDADVSLFRHFIVEMLDIMSPPYSVELVTLLLPLVSDTAITGALRQADGKDGVSEFLKDCRKVVRM